jgi:predicted nucleic acid-binding protein
MPREAVYFLDANVPIYAAGGAHPLREPCRVLIKAVASGRLRAVASLGVVFEVFHRALRAGDRSIALSAYDDFRTVVEGNVLEVDASDLARARELADLHPRLPATDLLHLATMERHEITAIVTADKHFDRIEGIERLDPAKLARRLGR